MTRNNKLFFFTSVLASGMALARPTSKANFDSAKIQVEVFKDADSFTTEAPIANKFAQFTVVRVDSEIVDAYVVSTGIDDPASKSIETAPGYFLFDLVEENFVYHNSSGSDVLEPWGLYFFDLPQVLPEGPAKTQMLNNDRRNKAALHSYAQNQINGSRLSHGCVRSPLAHVRSLWTRVDNTRDDQGTNNRADDTYDAALAIYGKALKLPDPSTHELKTILPESKRPTPISASDARTIKDLL